VGGGYFNVVTYDSSLTENRNEKVETVLPIEYFKAVFNSEQFRQFFCRYFDEELYEIAEKTQKRIAFHPFQECFPIIAVVKCLMDIQISERLGRKQPYDDMRYILSGIHSDFRIRRDNRSRDNFLDEFKGRLNKYDRIILYGAGNYGGALLEKIYDWHIYKKVEFAVSGEPNEKEHLGHNVYDISKIQMAKDNYIVVVAVGKKLEEKLINNLKRYNITSYIKLSDEMRGAL